MSRIHRTILNRLLAAWVVVSLLIGAGASWLGARKMDSQMVALATAELGRISTASLPLLNQPEARRDALNVMATDFVRQHFIAVEFHDRDRRVVAAAINPLHADIAREIRRQANGALASHDRYYGKFTVADQTALRMIVPLKDARGGIDGYFEGIFLIDRETLSRLRDEMIAMLLVVLLAVALTTACLYPVMLSLNRNVIRQSNDLLRGNIELMEVLGSAIAMRDSATNVHNYRVASYAVRLAEAVGLKHGEIRDLIAGAFLHDVGKIGISDNILLKPAGLDEEEFKTMRGHVSLGVDILRKSNWLQKARDVVEFHHERFDGSGYLKGLSGEAIPITARIFAIVDVFDALTSRRPYKEPLPFDEAMATLREGAGSHFDPRLMAAFTGIAEALYLDISNTPEAAAESRLQEIIRQYFFPSSR